MGNTAPACDVCTEALRKYVRRINEILRLFPQKGLINPAQRSVIRECYAQLKTEMREDYKRGVPKEIEAAKLDLHSPHFFDPLAKAFNHLHTPTNAVPNERLREELYTAQDDIELFLDRLARRT